MAEPDSAVPLAAELPGPRAHSNLRVQRLSGIGGLRVTGEIDMHTHSAWDDVLAELPTDGTPARLDLSGLSFIDVRGVAALTTAALRMPPDIQRDPVATQSRAGSVHQPGGQRIHRNAGHQQPALVVLAGMRGIGPRPRRITQVRLHIQVQQGHESSNRASTPISNTAAPVTPRRARDKRRGTEPAGTG